MVAYTRHDFNAPADRVEPASGDRAQGGDRCASCAGQVDAARFAELAQGPDVLAETDAIRRDAGGRQIVLGVDRLDYTKGIPRRLEAVERLLARDPGVRDRIRYIQVAVPSRGGVGLYHRFNWRVEQRVGRINGACGTLRSTPVHYVHRSVSARQLVALYRAADVMLVTPLRDGMNLVAKEFVASRVDEDGVLVLSEFAGAAAELDGALVVNPYDVEAVAASIDRALGMPVGERRARMKGLRRRVSEHDLNAWADGFLAQLDVARPFEGKPTVMRPEPCLVTALANAQRTSRLRLLLDYDGTLVPFARSPELAAPDEEVLSLLAGLATSPGMKVDIVSARPRQVLQAWFGEQPLSLWAEHGFWHRPRLGAEWQAAAPTRPDSLSRVQPILEQFTASTPGSCIEIKSASIAWHYRGVQREFGARQAHELRMLLGDALSNQPFEVLEGEKVIEVRLRGVSKAVVAHRVHAETCADTLVVAIGDDRTDEDLFRALPPSALTVAVGPRARGSVSTTIVPSDRCCACSWRKARSASTADGATRARVRAMSATCRITDGRLWSQPGCAWQAGWPRLFDDPVQFGTDENREDRPVAGGIHSTEAARTILTRRTPAERIDAANPDTGLGEVI